MVIINNFNSFTESNYIVLKTSHIQQKKSLLDRILNFFRRKSASEEKGVKHTAGNLKVIMFLFVFLQ